MSYHKLNKFLTSEDFNNHKVWLYHSLNGYWVNTKGQFLGDKFLHVVSDGFPLWTPEIRSYSQLKKKLIYLFDNVPIWYLGNEEWNLLDVPVSDANQNAVYLIRYTDDQPTYNPMQDEIAKLILEGEYGLFEN